MEPKAPPVEKALENLMAPEESHQICRGWNTAL